MGGGKKVRNKYSRVNMGPGPWDSQGAIQWVLYVGGCP